MPKAFKLKEAFGFNFYLLLKGFWEGRPPDLSYIINYLCLRLLKDLYVIGIHGKFLKGLQLLFEGV